MTKTQRIVFRVLSIPFLVIGGPLYFIGWLIVTVSAKCIEAWSGL